MISTQHTYKYVTINKICWKYKSKYITFGKHVTQHNKWAPLIKICHAKLKNKWHFYDLINLISEKKIEEITQTSI